ncbi:MAG: hypothetical protein GY729_11635, partial [Desulfobacteraceae bacterium]|nr:hypothetical protein [Desulfobacteraceae bacterium]
YKNNEQSIGVKCFDDSVPIRAWDKEKRESTDFRPQKFKGQVLPEWKMTSFSAITFLDHLTSPKNETSGSLSLTTTPSITLEKFPRGTGSGDFFHLIFEDLDFTVNAQQRKALVQSKMAAFGLHGKEFLSLADVSVNQVLHTLLSDKESEFALKDIGKDQRFNELEFLFSVERFNKSAVADLFKNYMPEQQAKTYAPKILQLSSQGFKGFIKGFIDLVFCHQDRWYIIDYKSNYLGNTYADYDLDAIHRAMAEHHYFLQYHIYLVALHRYLSIQLKNYDYQRDFGGVFYLFIRGMHPDFGSRYGVFFDRPDFTLVEKLSQGFLQQDGL